MILGGKDPDGQRVDSIEVYDPSLNLWRESEIKLRKPRSGFAAIKLKEYNLITIIGGNDGRVQNRVEALDIKTK